MQQRRYLSRDLDGARHPAGGGRLRVWGIEPHVCEGAGGGSVARTRRVQKDARQIWSRAPTTCRWPTWPRCAACTDAGACDYTQRVAPVAEACAATDLLACSSADIGDVDVSTSRTSCTDAGACSYTAQVLEVLEDCVASLAAACDAVDVSVDTAAADCSAVSGVYGNRCVFTAAAARILRHVAEPAAACAARATIGLLVLSWVVTTLHQSPGHRGVTAIDASACHG